MKQIVISFISCLLAVVLTVLGVIMHIHAAANVLIFLQVVTVLYTTLVLVLVTLSFVLSDETKIQTATQLKTLYDNKLYYPFVGFCRLCKVFMLGTLVIYGWWGMVILVVLSGINELVLDCYAKSLVETYLPKEIDGQ